MASESSKTEKTFEDLAKEAGLKQKSIVVLLEEDYDSVEALVTITDADLEALELTKGQKGIIRAWVSRLRAQASRKPTRGAKGGQGEGMLFDSQAQASASTHVAEGEGGISPDSPAQPSAPSHVTEKRATSSDNNPIASAPSHVSTGDVIPSDSSPKAFAPLPFTEEEATLFDSYAKAYAPLHVTKGEIMPSDSPPQGSRHLHVTSGEALSPDSPPQQPAPSHVTKGEAPSPDSPTQGSGPSHVTKGEALSPDSPPQASGPSHVTGKEAMSFNSYTKASAKTSAPLHVTKEEAMSSDTLPRQSTPLHVTKGEIMPSDSPPQGSRHLHVTSGEALSPDSPPQQPAPSHVTKGEAPSPDSPPQAFAPLRGTKGEAPSPDSPPQGSGPLHVTKGEAPSPDSPPQASASSHVTSGEAPSPDSPPQGSGTSHITKGEALSPDSPPQGSGPSHVTKRQAPSPDSSPQGSGPSHVTKGEARSPDSPPQGSGPSHVTEGEAPSPDSPSQGSGPSHVTKGEAPSPDSPTQGSGPSHVTKGEAPSPDSPPQGSGPSHVTKGEAPSPDSPTQGSGPSHVTKGEAPSPDSPTQGSGPLHVTKGEAPSPDSPPQGSGSLHVTKGEAPSPDSPTQGSGPLHVTKGEAPSPDSPPQAPGHSKSFKHLAKKAGLNHATIAKLKEQEYVSVQAVATITEDDLDALKLSMAQKGVLRAWVKRLRDQASKPPEPPITLTDTSMRKNNSDPNYEGTDEFRANYQKILTTLELSLNHPISLQRAIEVRESPDKLKVSDLPLRLISMLMGLHYQARDHFLSEMRESVDEDDSYVFEYSEVSGQCNEPNLRLNPLDVLLATFSCCDRFLQQILAQNMFLCKLAIPLLYPVETPEILSFSLWALRAIIVQCSGGSKPSKEVSVTDQPFPIITFVRLGSPNISKSNLLNHVLTEGKLQTFYSSECQRRSERKKIADGVLECSWFLPAFEETDLFSSVVLFLNLRGDASVYQKQMGLVNKVSSVVVAIANIEDIAHEPHVTTFKKICSGDKQVIKVLTSHSKYPEHKMVQTKLTALTNQVGKERLQKIKQILTFRDELKSNDLKVRLQEMLPKLLDGSCQMSLEEVAEIGGKDGFKIDENDPVGREGKRHAMNLLKEIKEKDVKTCKGDLLPLQGEVWARYTEVQKRLHKGSEQEGSNAQKDKLVEIRREQAQMCNKLTPFIRGFLNILLSTEQEVQMSFLQWMKLLLDSKSRSHLPHLHRKYFEVWRSLHKDSTRDSQDKISKAEKDIIDSSFGLEHVFRELGQIYEAVLDCGICVQPSLSKDVEMLPKAVAKLLLAGIPLELVDGDTSSVPITWVKAVLSELNTIITKKMEKLFVISVLGVQSSGKSTLLNTMFGLQFAVSAGRCTRGAFMQLIRVAQPDLPVGYIAVIDTEGLRAPELAQLKYNHDNELATFAIGLGDITLINIKGENTAEIKDALQTTVHAFIRMKLVNKELDIQRSCIFIHQNVPALNAKEKMMQSCQKLQDQLDEMTKEAAQSEGTIRYRSFAEIIQFDINQNVFYFLDFWQGNPPMAPVNVGYTKNATLVKRFLEESLKNQRTFLTVSDFARRIEDLRNGILSEDFVFCFRNSLEVKAYNSLEETYCRLKWDLESSITDWITRVAEIELKRCDKAKNLNEAFASLASNLTQFTESERFKSEKLLTEFFEKSEYKDIIIQWRQGMLKSLATESKTYVAQGMTHLHMIRDELEVDLLNKKDFDINRAKIMQRASQTADKLKGRKASDFELRQEFNKMWNPINDYLKAGKCTPEINIEREIRDVLASLSSKSTTSLNEELKKTVISLPLKNELLAASLSLDELEVNHYFSVAKPSTWVKIVNWATTFKQIPHDKHPKYLAYVEECKVKLFNETQSMLQATDDYLNELSVQGINFQRSHATNALKPILDRIEEFNNTKGRQYPTLSVHPTYTAKLLVHVSRRCHTVFDKMQSTYKQKHGIETKVNQIREEARVVFYHKVKESTEVDVAADLFCHQLKPIVESTVEAAIPKTIVKEVMEYFALRKSHLMFSILDGLAGQEDFMEYTKYIANSKSFALSWIKQHTDKTYFTKPQTGVSKYGELMEVHINLIMKEVEKSIQDANKRAGRKNKIDDWISAFCEIKEIPVNAGNLETFSKRDIGDFERLEEKIKAECDRMKTKLIVYYSSQTAEQIEWKGGSPYQQVIDKLWGCPAQCPFCGEPCSLAAHDATKEHHCLQHRPKGVFGTFRVWSNELVSDTCNYAVKSSTKFSCSFHKKGHDSCSESGGLLGLLFGGYHPFKDYKTFFPDWDITPDAENTASEYWAWFVNKYKDELANHHKAKPPSIPEKWKQITKKQALHNLRKDR